MTANELAALPSASVLCGREMLTYIRSAVTRNASEKKINSLLDFVAQSTNMQLLQVRPTFKNSESVCQHLKHASLVDSKSLAFISA